MGFFSGFAVFVIDFRAENFVFAVFAPGLGENFEFHIGRVGIQTVFFSAGGGAEIVLNRFHFLQREREDAFFAQFDQLFIGNLKVVFFNLNFF